jgi:hypothetical protein
MLTPGFNWSARQVVSDFQIWELEGDWDLGINLDDLCKSASGKEWTTFLNVATGVPPALQKTGT